MEISRIKDFVVLAEVLNYSIASELLFESQSTLSKHIKSLEKELGEALFDRNTRNIQLSRFGAEYLPYAKQILTAYDSSNLFITKYRGQHSGVISIGAINHPECYYVADVFMGFERTHPSVSLNIIEGNLIELEKLFLSGAVNMYCTCDKTVRPDVEFIPAGTDRLVAVIPKNDPLAVKDTLVPEDLRDRNLLLPADIIPFYPIIDEAFEKAGIIPKVVYRGTAISSIFLVHSVAGITIMSEVAAERFLEDDLCLKELSPEIEYEFGLGYRRRSELSESEKELLDYVIDYFK